MDPTTRLKQIRSERLQELIQRFGSHAECAKAVGKSPAQIHQWLHQIRSISERSAREMERHAHLQPGWFDLSNEPSATVAMAPAATYHVLAPAWPLETVSPERWARLPDRLRGRIDQIVADLVDEFERNAEQKSRHG